MRLLQNTRVVKPRPSLFSEGDVHGVRDDPRGALDLARDILGGDHERAEIALAYQPSRGELVGVPARRGGVVAHEIGQRRAQLRSARATSSENLLL